MNHILQLLIGAILLTGAASCSDEAEEPGTNIWDGPNITFEKQAGSDPSALENQDRIVEGVWITRGNEGGQIYNAASESTFDQSLSPLGTEWALGTLDEVDDLTFDTFRNTIAPKEIVGKNLVLHLITDDIYLSVNFTSWGQGNQSGAFSYQRTTNRLDTSN